MKYPGSRTIFAGVDGRTDTELPEWYRQRHGGKDTVSFAEAIRDLPQAVESTVAYKNPYTDEWVETERFNALVEPSRAREQAREEDAETDSLFHIPTDSYSIINPVDVFGPLEEVLREETIDGTPLGDVMFGEIRRYRGGGEVHMDVGLAENEQGNGLVDTAAALGLDSSDSTGSCGSSDTPPTVDSLSLSEVETDDSDAEFDADWQVSDEDGDLDSLDLTLYQLDSDGNRAETEDSASPPVSGDSASGTTRLVATGDDGSGNTYEVEAVVTDSKGNSDSATAQATESEGDSSPSASIDCISEVNSPSPHAEFDISWSASDSDDDLDTAKVTLYDDTNSQTEDSTTIDISGGSASGTTTLTAKFDEGSGNDYTAELVVTDSNGNTDSDIASFTES